MIAEDGLAAFCAVNWIRVAEDYFDWIDSGAAHELVPHKREGGHHTFKTHRLGVTGGSAKSSAPGKPKKFERDGETGGVIQTSQQKHFAKMAPLVDYLNMLRDTLSLHQNLMSARSIRYWSGPHTIELSTTIEHAFQQTIHSYNKVGQSLMKEMAAFPDEIMKGFHDPKPTKAETIKINAHAVQKDLLNKLKTAQVLGFFFPGSTLWELRRKLRGAGSYKQSDNVKFSLDIVPEDATIVGSGSMNLYIQADETAGVDSADFDPRRHEELAAMSSVTKDEEDAKKKKGKSKKSKKDNTSKEEKKKAKSTKEENRVSNPLFGAPGEDVSDDDDHDHPEEDSAGEDDKDDGDGGEEEDTLKNRLQLLRKVPILETLHKLELDAVAAACEQVRFEPKAAIITQGDLNGSEMFVLIKGRAAVFIQGPNDDAAVQAGTIKLGQFFGEKALQSDDGGTISPPIPRAATILADEETGATCLRLSRKAYDVVRGVLSTSETETTAEAASIEGMPGWREWIPHSARHVVNHDGQFFTDDEGIVDRMKSGSFLYPLGLLSYNGFMTYCSDMWNVIEFSMYSLFMVAFYCKVQMWLLEPTLEEGLAQALTGDKDYVDVAYFDYLNWLYMMTLTPNACIMWIKCAHHVVPAEQLYTALHCTALQLPSRCVVLAYVKLPATDCLPVCLSVASTSALFCSALLRLFKYIDVVPQMGILIKVLQRAVPSVTIFTFVAIIPVLGLAFSFTAVFGDTLYRYSTVSLSLNTLLRMSVGE